MDIEGIKGLDCLNSFRYCLDSLEGFNLLFFIVNEQILRIFLLKKFYML